MASAGRRSWPIRGTQKEIADDWFLAGTVAYQSVSGSNSGGQASSDVQAGDIGLGVKRVMGLWQFGAGLNLGYGDFDDTRVVTDGSAPSVMLTSDYQCVTRLEGVGQGLVFGKACWRAWP